MSGGAKGKTRLDQLLVDRGFYPTRSRAGDAVRRGGVSVSGSTATKPGMAVPDDAEIGIDDPAQHYVSRAALKLVAGLDKFAVDPSGKTCLDLGASTGGFTQVLLERGADRVIAIDVGHGQMDEAVAADHRVTRIEGLNARDLTLADLGGIAPELVVCDVSFISLKLALPPALGIAAQGAECVVLVKPQFEAGRDAIGKGGLLADPSQAQRIAEDMRQWLDNIPGWQAIGVAASPITGGDGNAEFLLGGRKGR